MATTKTKMAPKKRIRAEQLEINKKIGGRLKMAREWQNLSQADVARLLKVSRGRWSMYEAGKRQISVYVMIEFCELAAADPAFLLMGGRPKQPRLLAEKQRGAEIEEQSNNPSQAH